MSVPRRYQSRAHVEPGGPTPLVLPVLRLPTLRGSTPLGAGEHLRLLPLPPPQGALRLHCLGGLCLASGLRGLPLPRRELLRHRRLLGQRCGRVSCPIGGGATTRLRGWRGGGPGGVHPGMPSDDAGRAASRKAFTASGESKLRAT